MNAGFKLPTKIDTEPAERKFQLREYLNFVWRQWNFIGTFAALALVIASIYLVRATPLYTASAQILLDPRRERAGGAGDSILSDFQLDLSSIESQLAIIRSDSLLGRVVTKERLVTTDGKLTEPQRIQAAVDWLRGALTATRSGQSYVLNISITWDDPAKAAQLANAVADAYVVDQLDARFDAAKRASGWLSDRLVELRRQLRESEDAVAKFRAENRLARSGPKRCPQRPAAFGFE